MSCNSDFLPNDGITNGSFEGCYAFIDDCVEFVFGVIRIRPVKSKRERFEKGDLDSTGAVVCFDSKVDFSGV